MFKLNVFMLWRIMLSCSEPTNFGYHIFLGLMLWFESWWVHFFINLYSNVECRLVSWTSDTSVEKVLSAFVEMLLLERWISEKCSIIQLGFLDPKDSIFSPHVVQITLQVVVKSWGLSIHCGRQVSKICSTSWRFSSYGCVELYYIVLNCMW